MASRNTVLVTVPRKATEEVSFSAIRASIVRDYEESPAPFTEAIAQLGRMRQDAVYGNAGSESTARDLLYKYFGQLELLELRFPELKVVFPWRDAFTKETIAQQSLAYEKACVNFNVGATLSVLGASAAQDSTSIDSVKQGIYNFRAAAGMFLYINDNFLHAPSTDMNRDVVELLAKLMRAQATELFYLMTAGKSESLRSKIAKETAAFHESIVGLIQNVTKSSGSVFPNEWLALSRTKRDLYESAAQLHRGKFDYSKDKYGAAIARFDIANRLAKSAVSLSGGLRGNSLFASMSFDDDSADDDGAQTSSALMCATGKPAETLVDIAKSHAARVAEQADAAHRENDLIYHELVSQESSLDPIEPTQVAEPLAIQEVYAQSDVQRLVGADLFQQLVPLSVHETSSVYSEEKAKLVRSQQDLADRANSEFAAALEALSLPMALSDYRFKENTDVQSAIKTKFSSVFSNEARHAFQGVISSESRLPIAKCFSDHRRLRKDGQGVLDDITDDLRKEASRVEDARAEYGDSWSLKPSATTPESIAIHRDLSAIEKSFTDSAKSDDQVVSMWNRLYKDAHWIAMATGLTSTGDLFNAINGEPTSVDLVAPNDRLHAIQRYLTEELSKRVAEAVDSVRAETPESPEESFEQPITEIMSNIAQLHTLRDKRQAILAEVRALVHKDDIAQILMLTKSKPGSEDHVIATELEKYAPIKAKLSDTFAVQTSTLSAIAKAWRGIQDSPHAQRIQKFTSAAKLARNAVFSGIVKNAAMYRDIVDGLVRGVRFYADVLSLLRENERTVSVFLDKRQVEYSAAVNHADLAKSTEAKLSLKSQQAAAQQPHAAYNYPGYTAGYPAYAGFPQYAGGPSSTSTASPGGMIPPSPGSGFVPPPPGSGIVPPPPPVTYNAQQHGALANAFALGQHRQ